MRLPPLSMALPPNPRPAVREVRGGAGGAEVRIGASRPRPVKEWQPGWPAVAAPTSRPSDPCATSCAHKTRVDSWPATHTHEPSETLLPVPARRSSSPQCPVLRSTVHLPLSPPPRYLPIPPMPCPLWLPPAALPPTHTVLLLRHQPCAQRQQAAVHCANFITISISGHPPTLLPSADPGLKAVALPPTFHEMPPVPRFIQQHVLLSSCVSKGARKAA